MIYYIIFGLILVTILLVLISEFIHQSHEKFKKKFKFIVFIILLCAVIITMTKFPHVVSVIPAIFLILYRWRFIINFLITNFFFKNKKTTYSTYLNKDEAYEILGLNKGASKKEILNRYQELMKKNHPDKGGSDWITKKLNSARDTLLG